MDSYEFMRGQMAMRHNLINRTPIVSQRNDAVNVSPFPDKTPIGMAYVPVQQWGQIYEAGEALCRGTVFPELDYPFTGGAGCYE